MLEDREGSVKALLVIGAIVCHVLGIDPGKYTRKRTIVCQAPPVRLRLKIAQPNLIAAAFIQHAGDRWGLHRLNTYRSVSADFANVEHKIRRNVAEGVEWLIHQQIGFLVVEQCFQRHRVVSRMTS